MKINVNGLELDVEYEILDVNEAEGSILVKWFNADVPDGVTNWVNLPVQDGQVLPLDGEALDSYIMGMGPMWVFARPKVAKPSLAYLRSRVKNPKPPQAEVLLPAAGAPTPNTITVLPVTES